MRRLFMACAGAAALFMSPTFASHPAQAITLAAPAGLSKAIQDAKLTQDVAYVCRGGWWWRRCFFAAASAGPAATGTSATARARAGRQARRVTLPVSARAAPAARRERSAWGPAQAP